MEEHISKLTVDKPHFFIIILEESLSNQALRIPNSFISKYGNNLEDEIKIEAPNGDMWTIELKKRNGQVLLHNGWFEFAGFYSISHKHFLIFRYEGHSNFHAFIFNASCLEIDYPRRNDEDSEFDFVSEMEESDYDTSSDECYFSPPIHKEKGKTNRFGHFGYHESTSQKKHMKASYKRTHFGGNNLMGTCGSCMQRKIIEKVQTITALDRRIALQRAKAFTSQDPFFMVLIQPSYAAGKYLNVPNKFSKKYLGEDFMEIMLRSVDGRCWPVQYICSPKAKFSVGWRRFARDNSIRVGHICIFEFIRGREFSFKVTIFGDYEEDADVGFSS